MSYTNTWQSALGGGVLAASQNTISLSSLNGAQGSGYSGTLNFDEYTLRSDVKKYEVYEISQDLLALSVCWARYRKVRDKSGISYPAITKLLDSELFRLVTDEDIEQANAIRDYYSKKIMVWKLKNIKLTSYREDLNSFIHCDGKTFKESMLPLAYRLPEFYEYDVEFDKMSFDYNKEVKSQPVANYPATTKHLTYIKSLTVNTRRLKKIEYWFSDNHNNLVQMNVDTHNPLSSLLDKVITKGSIDLEGRYATRDRDGTEYIKVEKYKFI